MLRGRVSSEIAKMMYGRIDSRSDSSGILVHGVGGRKEESGEFQIIFVFEIGAVHRFGQFSRQSIN
jgi:hypothetical protein